MTSEILNIEQRHIWSVSALNREIRKLLEEEIGYIWLSGEISNWRVAPSGHAYFTLKDADSEITSAMFRGYLQNVKFQPENGMEVLVFGQVTVYEKRGTHQIIVEQMEPKGVGALQLAFEQLKKKLEAEGLFDPAHKKKLPLLPKNRNCYIAFRCCDTRYIKGIVSSLCEYSYCSLSCASTRRGSQ